MLVHYLKRGAYATFFYSISSIIVRGMSFLFLPYFLSRLTLIEFGIWDFYQLFFSTGTLLLSTCSSTALIRFYILYKDDSLKKNQSIGNALLFVTVSIICLPIFFFSIIPYCGLSSSSNEYLGITVLSVIFFALFTMVLALLRVQEKLLLYSLAFCGQNFLAIVGTLVGVHYNYGIQSFFYANLISFLVFLPFFIYFFLRYSYFSWPLFKDQIAYSLPLLIYSLIYISFFSIDKLFIKKHLGLEELGLYGLLWRFGSIFQMLGVAMIDAWYLMIYNAQNEINGHYLISKLISYYSMLLVSCCLYAIIGSYCAIYFIFPVKYLYITSYLPLFFLPLLFVEKARLFQTAFGLSTKTLYMPLISAGVVCLQTIFLFCFKYYALWGIFFANSLAFLLYTLICYVISLKIYPHNIIHKGIISTLLFLFCLFIMIMHFIINSYYAPGFIITVLICLSGIWPVLMWFFIIDNHEKRWVLEKLNMRLYTRRVNG